VVRGLMTILVARLRELLALGSGPLHDAGVMLSCLVLLAGLLALILRIRSWMARRPSFRSSAPIYRMTAVLGALGGFAAYLSDPSSAHGSLDLALGGLAALPWMITLGIELLGGRSQS
jgi:hypothetical protein